MATARGREAGTKSVMDAKARHEAKRSRHLTEGVERAPNPAFKLRPFLADLKSGGRRVAKYLFQAGDVPSLWNQDQDMAVPANKLSGATLDDHAIIAIDAEKDTLNVNVSKVGLDTRQPGWKPRPEFASGRLWKRAEPVGPAPSGVVIRPGAAAEKKCYADI